MVSARISSQDLDRTIVLRQLSLESQIICAYHPIVVVSLLMLLDRSATFDITDHKILLSRLKN